jgi:hypothetical protein
VLVGVALGGVGVAAWAARSPAPPHATPARKIARLRARAARVQAAIDRMNARVESLVEGHNQVRESLARTRVEQARAGRQVLAAGLCCAGWPPSGRPGRPPGGAGRPRAPPGGR